MARSPWSKKEKAEFAVWHEQRLRELKYPEKLAVELHKACSSWLTSIPTRTQEAEHACSKLS